MHRFYRSAVFALLAAALPACNGAPTVGVPDPEFDLVSPANGAIAVSTAPTFFWTTSIGAMTYTLQVSTDIGFSTFVVDQPGIAGTSVTPGTTLSDGTVYYWRVIADHSSGNVTANAAPFSFTTVAAVPGPFTLTSPTNGITGISTTPTFTWTTSLGAASYRLQVSTGPGFTLIVAEQAGLLGTSTTLTTPLSTSTAYFWQVIAESTSTTTASNAPFAFTTGTGPPGPFTMTSPANSATAVATLPTYTWTPSVGATSYRLEVSTTFNFVTNVLDQTGIIGTSFTQTTPVLLHGVTYYWRVTATGPGGDTLASPSPSSFTTG
jgi:hypothetical protein